MSKRFRHLQFQDPDPRLTAEWLADRDLRNRLPLDEAWRGCVGLAVLYRNAEHALNHGPACLLPNDHLRWLALRDVPVGHFPGSPSMDRRDVNLASWTQAKLRYGMPVVNFTDNPRDTWDFRFRPFATARRRLGSQPWDHAIVEAAGDTLRADWYRREFAVLNRLSAAMTHFAFNANDRCGLPVRPKWRVARPPDAAVPMTVSDAREWFPRAYLSFPRHRLDDVLRAATQRQPKRVVLPCRKCGEHVQVETFERQAAWLRTRPTREGEWVARCPSCHQPKRWRLCDAIPAAMRHHVPIAFKERFTSTIAEGLPLLASGPCVYCGPLRFSSDRDLPNLPDAEVRRLTLVPHRFRCGVTGDMSLVYLPADANIVPKQGQSLTGGELWAYALTAVPAAVWCAQDRAARWVTRAAACGGAGYAAHLQDVWLRHQVVRHPEVSQDVLLPADLVAWAVRDVPPTGLFWDVRATAAFDDWALEAAVFPPMRVHHWDRLMFQMPGEVRMDASIADPRSWGDRNMHPGTFTVDTMTFGASGILPAYSHARLAS